MTLWLQLILIWLSLAAVILLPLASLLKRQAPPLSQEDAARLREYETHLSPRGGRPRCSWGRLRPRCGEAPHGLTCHPDRRPPGEEGAPAILDAWRAAHGADPWFG